MANGRSGLPAPSTRAKVSHAACTLFDSAVCAASSRKMRRRRSPRTRSVVSVMAEKTPPMLPSLCLLVVERNNYREEAYFTYSYSPIKHSDGSIGGVFSAITETTERVLGERRLRILRELAAQTAESKSVQAACEAFARVLGADNPDLPFAILYLLDEDGTFASLLAKTGIDDAFASAALRLDHDDPWGVARVIREGDVILMNDLALHFATLPGGVWPEPTTSAIVLPIAKPGQKGGTAGVLVAGINPRRALDDAYRGFFDLVAGHLATAVSNARAYEEERKRADALAENNRD